MKDLGKKIEKLLEQNNMTQKELAEKVGCTDLAMSRFISGDRTPFPTILINIATVLGTTPEYLFDMEEETIIPMRANKYQELAMRTNDGLCTERLLKACETPAFDVGGIVNASFGLSGETGELNDMIKKVIFHGHSIDLVKVKKELGDIMWYVAMMCASFGFEMEEIMQMNIDKLKARYPEGFDPERSQHRKAGDI